MLPSTRLVQFERVVGKTKRDLSPFFFFSPLRLETLTIAHLPFRPVTADPILSLNLYNWLYYSKTAVEKITYVLKRKSETFERVWGPFSPNCERTLMCWICYKWRQWESMRDLINSYGTTHDHWFALHQKQHRCLGESCPKLLLSFFQCLVCVIYAFALRLCDACLVF